MGHLGKTRSIEVQDRHLGSVMKLENVYFNTQCMPCVVVWNRFSNLSFWEHRMNFLSVFPCPQKTTSVAQKLPLHKLHLFKPSLGILIDVFSRSMAKALNQSDLSKFGHIGAFSVQQRQFQFEADTFHAFEVWVKPVPRAGSALLRPPTRFVLLSFV